LTLHRPTYDQIHVVHPPQPRRLGHAREFEAGLAGKEAEAMQARAAEARRHFDPVREHVSPAHGRPHLYAHVDTLIHVARPVFGGQQIEHLRPLDPISPRRVPGLRVIGLDLQCAVRDGSDLFL
jgi:hypothetical protein